MSSHPPARTDPRGAADLSSILFASHTPESSVFRVGSHHLSRQLAVAGHRVGHLSTPLSPLKLAGLGDRVGLGERWRSWVTGPVTDETGRSSAVPFTLLPVQVTGAWAHNAGLRTALPPLRSLVRRMGLSEVDVLLVDQPLFAGLERLVPAGRLVYRPTDVYTAPRLVAAQARLLAAADAVVATSQPVLDALPPAARDLPNLVLGNGVDVEAFRRPPGDGPGEAAAVYVGSMDGRLDWDWLRALARAQPLVRIDLFGPRPDPLPEDLGPRVRFGGPVGYPELPALLARYRVGLMPFAASAANEGRSPMKFYEYLAAGLRVLSTPHVAFPPGTPGVRVEESGEGAGAALGELVADSTPNAAGTAAAAEQDWSRRAHALVRFLGAIAA